MITKITVIHDRPLRADAFEQGQPLHIAVRSAIAEIETLEASKGWPDTDRAPASAYRVVDLGTIGGRIHWGRQQLHACVTGHAPNHSTRQSASAGERSAP